MQNNIFVPKTINVGYQNRTDTYTGKLAYVIYYDEKGKLRKEASWQSWRDKDIPNEEFDNVPTSGFVLNKKVGDYDSGWEHRHAYCRVYDPRNFEFEITIENLLYILENANSIKGKGLEGEFVYGWDGKDLVLMPVESPDYKQIAEYNKIVHNNESIKAKDLIIGATYLTKENTEWIYMGRFDYYSCGFEWIQDGKTVRSKHSKDIPRIDRWGIIEHEYIENYPYGKYYWFATKYKDEWSFKQVKSILKNKLISCIYDKCTPLYAEIFDEMEKTSSYSPYDPSKDIVCDMSLDEFLSPSKPPYYFNVQFISSYDGKNESYLADSCYRENEGKYIIKKLNPINNSRYNRSHYEVYNKVILQPMELTKIYNIMKPKYIQQYLTNGREYTKRYKL